MNIIILSHNRAKLNFILTNNILEFFLERNFRKTNFKIINLI